MPVSLDALSGFCTVLATRYKGRVAGYQIWNEPNLAREWGGHVPDPAGYVALLRTCYVAIKHVDPDALVITAGLLRPGLRRPRRSPIWITSRGCTRPALRPTYDLLGLNAPGYKAPPEISPTGGRCSRQLLWRAFVFLFPACRGDAWRDGALWR